MGNAATLTISSQGERLDRELTALATVQFDTPEFCLLFETPLTMQRARYLALQFVFYNVNRRDCSGSTRVTSATANHGQHYDPLNMLLSGDTLLLPEEARGSTLQHRWNQPSTGIGD